MNVAGFIARRIAFNRQKSFSRFIIRLSVVATAISVAVMIITLAFVNGFQETVSQKVFSFWGHIRVQDKQPLRTPIAEQIPIRKNDTVERLIRNHPGVQSVHAFATKYAILKASDEIEGLLVKGLDKNTDRSHLEPFIKEGRWIEYPDSGYSKEILISVQTANTLHLKVNDEILTLFIQDDGERRSRKLKIAGLYKTGIEEYDKSFVLCDMRLIQRVSNNWTENDIGGYEIFLKDYRDIDRIKQEIFALQAFPVTWDTKGVNEFYQNIFDWLKMQNTTRWVLLGLMIGVAVLNLITCLIILVLERIRMIGILKSLGASDGTVQKIFLSHSLLITLGGIVLGVIFGIGLCILQQQTGFIRLQEDAYYMSTAAVKIVWWEVLMVCAGTLLITLLVLMIPSFVVKKVQPVRAVQFR